MSTYIGDRIQEVRRAKGLSVESLAELSGVSVGSIRAYEQGRRIPSKPTLIRIEKALDFQILANKESLGRFPGDNRKSKVSSDGYTLVTNSSSSKTDPIMLDLIEKIHRLSPAKLAALHILLEEN